MSTTCILLCCLLFLLFFCLWLYDICSYITVYKRNEICILHQTVCLKDPRDRSSGANLDKSAQHKSPLSVIQIWISFISRVLTKHALRIIPTYLQIIRTLLTVEVCTWFGGSSKTSEGPRFCRLSSTSAGASVFSSECNVREGGGGSFVERIVSLVDKHTWTDTKFQQTFVIV